MSDFVEKVTLDLTGTAVDGKAAAGLGQTGEGVKGLMGDLDKLSNNTSAEATLGKIGASVDNLGASLLKMAGAFVGFEALKALAGDVLGAVKEHENLTLTIAATMAATNGWSASMGIATGVLEKLKETAALVGGTETQMVDTFNLLKRTFGGTSDQAVDLTGKLALLARQYNTTVDTLATRLAMAGNTGNLMPRGVAGIALTSTGIDATELQTMKDAGQAMEYLNAKIADNPELVDQLKNTWSYLTAELAKSKHEAMETIGMGFEPLKVVLQELVGNLNSPATQSSFQNLSGQIRGLNQDLVDLAFAGKTSGFQIPSFTDTIITPIIKGARVALAELILLATEVNTVVQYIFQAATHPMEYALDGPGSLAHLKQTLADIVNAYKDNAAQIAAIQSPFVMASSHGAPSPEVPTAPSPPSPAAVVKDNSAEIAATIKNLWDQVGAYAETGLAKELALEEATTAKEIAAFTEKATTEKQVIDGTLAYKALAAVKEQALNFASQAKNEAEIEKQRKQAMDQEDWLVAEQTKLYDELAGVSDDYYVKQQAHIDRSIERENDLLDKRLDDDKLTQAGYDALMVTLQKLYDAQTDQLAQEQNSIIGFRKTMEEQAALLVKTTDSVAGGIAAGMATIMASAKSTTESTRDYIVGVWGALTTGLGTVLKTLETGTGTIKDTLKGILNSLLDSFNTMVVEMVKKWLLGQDQMKAGTSGSGGLSSLFAGAGVASSIDAQGNVVYHGGTINTVTKGQGTQGVVTQQQPSGVGALGAIGGAVTGLGIGSLIGGLSGAPGFSTGAAIGGVVGGALAIIVPAVGAWLATTLGGAEVGSLGGPLGTAIGAVVGAIVGGIIAILSSPNTEGHVFGRDFMPQIKAVAEGIQSSLVEVFATSLLPDAAGFAKSLNDRIKTYLQSAALFEVHAGSSEDITKDIQSLLSGIIPTELLHTLIGQQRTGGQDVAGISGASTYGGQLDPKAPINKMLTDLGFTAGEIQALAGQIDSMAPADWMKMLSGLVGVVAGAQALGKQLSMTYADTIASADAASGASPAGKLADQAAAVTDLLQAVSFYTGTEQITKGQEAITAAQQFYNDAKTAMLQLSAMAKQVTQDVADSTKKVLDSLKTPAELAAQSVADLQADYQRMRFAANAEDLAAAWASAKTDFEAVAGELVNRIKQIQTVLTDIHTLQDAMAAGPAINATTDPQAWLAQNMIDIGKYEVAMKAALPGSPEEIAAATSMSGLIRDRYTMELDLLARVKSTIEAIDQSIGASLIELQMQGMGSVVDGKWVADTHAQGDFMMSQVTALQGQLAGAQTPEEVQNIVSQIQALVGKLGGQAQDPTHYAESLKILAQILKDTQKAADDRLKAMGTSAQVDITKLGPLLAQAEAAMQAALTQATTDLDALVWHFKRAGEFAAGQLDLWGTQIADQLNLLGPILTAMVLNFTDVNAALSGGGTGTGGPGKEPVIPLADDLTSLGSGVNDARGALVDFTATVKNATNALGGKAA